jgi:hypothetical protein
MPGMSRRHEAVISWRQLKLAWLVAEPALDDVGWHALASQLERVRVPHPVRRERTPYAASAATRRNSVPPYEEQRAVRTGESVTQSHSLPRPPSSPIRRSACSSYCHRPSILLRRSGRRRYVGMDGCGGSISGRR